MSAASKGMRGGQPSTTHPIPGPWLSPKVVKRNRCPKVLWDMASDTVHTGRPCAASNRIGCPEGRPSADGLWRRPIPATLHSFQIHLNGRMPSPRQNGQESNGTTWRMVNAEDTDRYRDRRRARIRASCRARPDRHHDGSCRRSRRDRQHGAGEGLDEGEAEEGQAPPHGQEGQEAGGRVRASRAGRASAQELSRERTTDPNSRKCEPPHLLTVGRFFYFRRSRSFRRVRAHVKLARGFWGGAFGERRVLVR